MDQYDEQRQTYVRARAQQIHESLKSKSAEEKNAAFYLMRCLEAGFEIESFSSETGNASGAEAWNDICKKLNGSFGQIINGRGLDDRTKILMRGVENPLYHPLPELFGKHPKESSLFSALPATPATPPPATPIRAAKPTQREELASMVAAAHAMTPELIAGAHARHTLASAVPPGGHTMESARKIAAIEFDTGKGDAASFTTKERYVAFRSCELLGTLRVAGGAAESSSNSADRRIGELNMSPEQRAQWANAIADREWESSDPNIKGFSTKERYRAIRAQQLLGNFKISGKDARQFNPPAAQASPVAGGPPVDPGNDAPPERRLQWAKARAEYEWNNADPRCRGFSSRERYVAFRSGELVGRLKAFARP